MAHLFVSYSRRNRDRVGDIAGALEQSGYSLWWDRQLASGADYGSVIEREIGAAGCVVVAWSESARESLWVRAEANEALDAGKLVQLSLDGAKMPLPFTMLHFLDFREWHGQRDRPPWSELETRVRDYLGGDERRPLPREIVLGGPRLEGYGKAAVLGWAALAVAGLMALAIALTAMGSLPRGLFESLSLFGFAVAAILFGLTTWMMIRTMAATQR